MAPLITLTTDFGHEGPFIGVMKGVILGHLPEARIIDLTHEIPVHWPVEAGFWLARAYRHFPAGTIHVAVVDPGVGTTRDIIAAHHDGHLFLAPDNGLLAPVIGERCPRCHRLSAEWLATQGWPRPSHTFHGRDVFAPLAAGLAAGRIRIDDIGPPAGDIVPSLQEPPEPGAHEVRGTIIALDHFGNLVSNIEGALIDNWRRCEVLVGGHRLTLRRTYGDVPPGELLALINAFGVLEIARAEGNASEALGLGRGAPLTAVNPLR